MPPRLVVARAQKEKPRQILSFLIIADRLSGPTGNVQGYRNGGAFELPRRQNGDIGAVRTRLANEDKREGEGEGG